MKNLIILLLIISFVFVGCEKSTDSSEPILNPENPVSPFPDEEVEQMTLWYGDEIRADYEIYKRFLNSLNQLRNDYGDSIQYVDIPFSLPYSDNSIYIGLTDSAVLEIRNDNYHAWDDLNLEFGITEIDTSRIYIYPGVYLRFDKRLNPKILKSFYDSLPGVRLTEVNAFIGDWSNIYPWIHNDTITFLVRYAYGDCPAGCIVSHFFYFKEINNQIELVNEWLKDSGWTNAPDWFKEEAGTAFWFYRHNTTEAPI